MESRTGAAAMDVASTQLFSLPLKLLLRQA
jgi:hypothetical protein